MNDLQRWLMIGVVSTSICQMTWAAMIIERHDIQGKTETIIIDKQQVRINASNSNNYTLLDLNKRKVYFVDGKKERIVEMDIKGTPPKLSQNIPKPPSPPWGDSIEPELVSQGEGPEIAGYSTVHYQVKALSRVCSDHYFSKEAANKLAYLNDFLEVMSEMSRSRKIQGMPVHPCQQALEDLETESAKLGIPMKSIIKGGRGDKVKHEILSIKTKSDISTNTFTLPNYNKINEQQWREETQREMRMRMKEAQRRGNHHHRHSPGHPMPPR